MRRTLAPALNTEREMRLGEGWGGLVQNVHLFQVTTAMAMTKRRVTITVSEIARACGKIGCEFDGDMEGVGEMWLVLECG